MPSKKFLSKSVFQTLLLIAIFVTGYNFGKFINNIPYFEVEKKINLVEIFSIALTLFVAWYIAKILDKEKEDNRNEKDLLLKRMDGIFQIIEDSNVKAMTGEIPYIEASSFIKRIHNSIDSVCNILGSTELTINEGFKNNIFQNTRKLRDLFTDTPISLSNTSQIQAAPPPLEVINGIIHFSSSRLSEIEIEFDKLKDNFLLLQLAINKA